MKREEYSRPLDLKKVRVTDRFWSMEQELVRTEVIPYQWQALNDRIPEAAPSYCMRNFKTAGKLMKQKREQGTQFQEPVYTFRGFEALPEDPKKLEDKFYGFVFQDSDFSKWIEAVAYSLAQHPDEDLERTADEAIDIVCAAQLENGYLDTYYIINGMDKSFSNLRDHHELYCFGHLAEGAVAYCQATGKDKLLKAAMGFADYIVSYFGPEERKCKGYPGHEIAEMALVRLYEVTGEKKYLDMSRFFVDERGKKPYYYDKEHGQKPAGEGELRYHYHQAHLPVRKQSEALGHAVRAVYLYSGMADVARITGDEELFQACERLWEDITDRKMYITGGIGGTHIGEAFSYPYDLPNDTAYAETCAAIGLVFFARRMLEIKPHGKYGDVMERALYNGVLSGMAMDGKSFFYVNPLEAVPEACRKDERKFHVKPVRQKWFGCACCPPNIARLLSSVSAYAYTENEDTLFVHLYMGSILEKTVGEHKADIRVEADFPWEGTVRAQIRTDEAFSFKLALRIPGWCRNYSIKVNGEEQDREELQGAVRDGYLYLERIWQDGDRVELFFPMTVKKFKSNPRVRENIGRTAFMRGPLVYCMEEADNGKELHLFRIRNLPEEAGSICIEGNSLPVLKAAGEKLTVKEAGELYPEAGEGAYQESYEPSEITLIPYYAWANRGEGEMQVWIREA